jgi:hypothetical protein
MKTKKLIQFALIIMILLNVNLFSQVEYKAAVKNQTLALGDATYGDCIYFDVYLQKNGGSGPLYLANADFKFTFNQENFTGDAIEYIDESNELYNSSGASTTYYNANIAPAFVAPNILSISVAGLVFTTQIQFNTRVAMIDGTADKHKLGQFVVYTISNTSGKFGLNWLTGVGGTVVTSFEAVSPWASSPATGTLEQITDTPLPVELSSFTANSNQRDINLSWQTKTEINSNNFQIERTQQGNQSWLRIGEVTAGGNSISQKEYSFTDNKLNSGKYSYRLKMVDNDGTYKYSDAIEAEISLPKEYAVSQNYPNPFNPTTRIDYQLPFDSKVTIELYGITGEKAATLINGELSAGYYTTDVNASQLNLASGVYIYRMSSQNSSEKNFVQVKKLMLIK